MERVILASLLLSGVCQAAIDVHATASNTSAIQNYNTLVPSLHEYHITNTKDKEITYFLYATVCATNQGCAHNDWSVKLNPGEKYTKYYSLQLPAMFRVAGTYTSTVTTSVRGDETKQSASNGSIWVTN